MAHADDVATTIADAKLEQTDERKLMPLAQARERVRATEVLKGSGAEQDQVWAALVSLEDAEEFVREASRITFQAHPRGHENLAFLQRYGPGIFGWLRRFYDAEQGSLRNTPWCVRPILLELGTPEAFAIVWGTRTMEGFEVGDQLLGPWMARWPEVGFGELAKLAASGDERAKKELKRFAKGRSRRAMAAIGQALGPDAAGALAKKLKLTAKLEAGEILAVLDEAVKANAWPGFGHALRLVAARAKDTDAWGLALERLTGEDAPGLLIERFLFGSEVPSGRSAEASVKAPLELGGLEETKPAVGRKVTGPGGTLTLTEAELTSLDLRPAESLAGENVAPSAAVVLVRAWLAKFPGSLWPKVEETVAALKVPLDGALILQTDQFQHTVAGERPSEHRTYKSLAQALVMRKAEKLKPGEPNTDWRLHLP